MPDLLSQTLLKEAQVFSIGNVTLHGFEAPEVLHVPGEQITAVHRYIGGGRAVQTLGAQDGQIRWRGHLIPQPAFGNTDNKVVYPAITDPVARAQQLDTLRRAGDEVSFIFGALQWQVVVSEFIYDIRNKNRIEYAITLTVIQNVGGSFQNDEGLNQQQILAKLATLSSDLSAIFDALQQAEVYVFLAAATRKSIEEGANTQAGLAGLIAANALVPGLGLINIANNLLRVAGVIEVGVSVITG